MSWDANITHVDFDWNEAVGASSNLHALASPLELLHTLPLEPTPLNSELLQIYVKVISRFKSSLDGDPDFNAPFHKYYLPFCLQSPLLARVSIYTAACLLSETNHLDKTITMWIKGSAIRLLNDLLRSERFATGDEAIAGVAQLIADEWYWGDTHDLRAHLEGMRQMIKLRGGFRNLGLNGLLSKMVIMTDFCIAITFEEPPYLHNGAEFEFSDTNPGPFKIAHNTPLLPSIDTFASCADAYKLHPTTASILDDIRFLIATIVALQKDVSSQENKKLRSTAQWIHGRIAALPPDSPESTRSSSSSTPDLSASSNTSQNSTQSTQQARSDFQPNSFDKPPYCPQPDYLYQSIRLAALIYTSAIIARKPFSESCSLQKLYELWKTVWRVPLATWKSMLGIFLWIEVAITPPARDTPHGRFVKSMLSVAGLNLGIENWHASSNALRGAMRLQAWLNEGRE
ncbi:uncharacterized protein BCR38DRAFT_355048 [Pseudomassariella vexata]|uniref:Uncharacterized protein n=1 Tax=Pseudomassariella vexata TaxID=1141098 RepID=A0A1Y2DF24_9PEZI|nr:uncharacterized protein BCR38DRAFT_355048 [Pseudomassariella vexata]ORY57265.1 hypothetical protein BCR38DRAFT_355048 [Pseudomassariella vexata]